MMNDTNLYKRIKDNKIFQIVEVNQRFEGMINFYDGPYYSKEYTLSSIDSTEQLTATQSSLSRLFVVTTTNADI